MLPICDQGYYAKSFYMHFILPRFRRDVKSIRSPWMNKSDTQLSHSSTHVASPKLMWPVSNFTPQRRMRLSTRQLNFTLLFLRITAQWYSKDRYRIRLLNYTEVIMAEIFRYAPHSVSPQRPTKLRWNFVHQQCSKECDFLHLPSYPNLIVPHQSVNSLQGVITDAITLKLCRSM